MRRRGKVGMEIWSRVVVVRVRVAYAFLAACRPR